MYKDIVIFKEEKNIQIEKAIKARRPEEEDLDDDTLHPPALNDLISKSIK